MSLGEYVSVSSQRDSESAQLRLERSELAQLPEQELEELAAIYRGKGLSASTAQLVATELTEHDALAAHADAELGIDPEALTNAWHAAFASAIAFVVGALLPLSAILLAPASGRVSVTVVAVLFALALTGTVNARIGGGPARVAVRRVVVGGALGLGLTYAIGRLVGGGLG